MNSLASLIQTKTPTNQEQQNDALNLDISLDCSIEDSFSDITYKKTFQISEFDSSPFQQAQYSSKYQRKESLTTKQQKKWQQEGLQNKIKNSKIFRVLKIIISILIFTLFLKLVLMNCFIYQTGIDCQKSGKNRGTKSPILKVIINSGLKQNAQKFEQFEDRETLFSNPPQQEFDDKYSGNSDQTVKQQIRHSQSTFVLKDKKDERIIEKNFGEQRNNLQKEIEKSVPEQGNQKILLIKEDHYEREHKFSKEKAKEFSVQSSSVEIQTVLKQNQSGIKQPITNKVSKNQSLSVSTSFNLSLSSSSNQKPTQTSLSIGTTPKLYSIPQPKSNSLKKTNPEECQKHIQDIRLKYGKLYRMAVPFENFYANSNVTTFQYSTLTEIDKEKYAEAVNAIDLIHHVQSNGNLIVKDNPCENIQDTIQRLNQTLHKQFKRLNQLYQIDFYHQHQLRFCIVSNSFKNAENGLVYRNIDSILQQNYTNYHVVYTDDASPDRTGEIVKSYLKEQGVEDGRFKVKINAEKKGMMENIFNAITQDCELGEIAVMLDGDDSFIGTNVLSLLNAVYQKEKMALIWNNFIQIQFDKLAMLGFSRKIDDFKRDRADLRAKGMLLSSHLKSFYVDLFRKIKVQDLQENNGVFYGGASDTAMMLPMLEMCFPRFKYVPEIVYEYRLDTGQLGMAINREAQLRALSKIESSSSYLQLEDFSFIDRSIQKALNSTKQ